MSSNFKRLTGIVRGGVATRQATKRIKKAFHSNPIKRRANAITETGLCDDGREGA